MTHRPAELFPDLAWRVYANHAAVGPSPRPVVDAIDAAMRLQARHGVAAIPDLLETVGQVRTRAAALVGGDPEGIALTTNTSHGALAVAHGMDWAPGDRVVLLEGEFPANTTPWQIAARTYDLDIVWQKVESYRGSSGDGLSQLQTLLRGGVRLIAVSAVQFQTGLRMPLSEIAALAHAHGAEVFVDGIQAVGSVPLDLVDDGIDYLTFGGHKWLMGPLGTGVLVARPARWATLRPRLASWLSHVDPLRFLEGASGQLTYDQPLAHTPRMLEGGALNFAGHTGLAAALALLDDHSPSSTFAHTQAWHDGVEPILLGLGFETMRASDPAQRSAILSLRPPPDIDVAALAAELQRAGISVSTPDGLLRFSPSWPNPLDEVDVVVQATTQAVRDLRGGTTRTQGAP